MTRCSGRYLVYGEWQLSILAGASETIDHQAAFVVELSKMQSMRVKWCEPPAGAPLVDTLAGIRACPHSYGRCNLQTPLSKLGPLLRWAGSTAVAS